MQFNDKFSMQNLFMNNKFAEIFPQFTKQDGLKNVYSFAWVDQKVREYIQSTFNGQFDGENVVITGKFKSKFKEIRALKTLLENMFNNLPALTKNIKKDTKLITPFQCIDQIQNLKDPKQKILAMQIVLDNLNYNPDFQSQNRISPNSTSLDFFTRQNMWLAQVGYDKIKGNKK